MAKYNHKNYVRRIEKMKDRTLSREYWKICFNHEIKFRQARLRALAEQMIQRFLKTNPLENKEKISEAHKRKIVRKKQK